MSETFVTAKARTARLNCVVVRACRGICQDCKVEMQENVHVCEDQHDPQYIVMLCEDCCPKCPGGFSSQYQNDDLVTAGRYGR